ncbi:L,D-transpeptidase [Olsenella urininfantis]|uniref:L,D-transpeptidase n=1 Tax=Olsenella urininfantis TaxID=1871033 RepID=UPI000985126A|nr:L,D-transpeptidase [Olsenella urininfantis]
MTTRAHAKIEETEKSSVAARRRTAIAAVAALALLLACYGVGCLHYAHHFVPGTSVNGVDASGLSEEDLSLRLQEAAAAWSCKVSGDGLDLSVSSSDVDLTVDAAGAARQLRQEAEPARWPLDLVSPTRRELELASFDAEKLSALVASACAKANAEATQPQDAYASLDAQTGRFVARESQLGSAVEPSAVEARVSEGARRLSASCELGDAELVQPATRVDSPELLAAIERANSMLALEIPLVREGSEVARVGGETLAKWVSIDSSQQVNVDGTAIERWAEGSLAASAAHSNEVYDWELDVPACAQQLAGAISNVSAAPVELPMEVVDERPPESEGARELGRHIDINLDTQYARFYDGDGKVIWRSYIVSGKVAEGRSTPTGTFSINAKQTDQRLVGADEDEDGKPDYVSPVRYWMPFLGGEYGLHDASWRAYFGGSIYYYNGSHGCVNLPSEKAEELFGLVNVGDKVHIHW